MSAVHAISALKTALRAHLAGHAPLASALSGGLHDAPPRNASPPYLGMADASLRENATNDADGWIVEIDLAVHTAERGTERALAIVRLIEQRLETPFSLAAHRLVLLTLRETLVRHDPAKSITRAALRLRAFIEPA
jgi:nitrate/nitrite-specific signal transduction histidine kinase